MRSARKATWVVTATALTLGSVGLTGCGTSSNPSVPTASKATTTATAAPSTTATTATKAAPPVSVAVAGYQPAAVAEAVRFGERFARFAMSGCGSPMLPVLESMMTTALYDASVKSSKPPVYLTFEPPTIMSLGCVTSQDLSEGSVGRGPEVKGVPSIRVAVTVTESLKVSTTTDPKTLKPVTVSRRYTIDVLPFGKDWQASDVKTSGSRVIAGK